jgi:hypothetical protein
MASRQKAKISRRLPAVLATTLPPAANWDAERDAIDLAVAGELDVWRLDTLTDWVIAARAAITAPSTEPR